MNPLGKADFYDAQAAFDQVDNQRKNYDDAYHEFLTMLFDTFKVNSVEELPIEKIEHAFSIMNKEGDFVFDDEDLRLDNFLLIMACLYYLKKTDKICFIGPTHFYVSQAARFRNNIFTGLRGSIEPFFSTVVPGMDGYEESVKNSEVVFMHGQDYSKHLPEGWTGRKIIQIFPGENVPVDPHHVSYCSLCSDD